MKKSSRFGGCFLKWVNNGYLSVLKGVIKGVIGRNFSRHRATIAKTKPGLTLSKLRKIGHLARIERFELSRPFRDLLP